MIYSLQRLFGRSDKKDFSSTSETAMRDLIKVLVMGYNQRNANKHWIGVVSTSLLDAGRKSYSSRPKIYGFLGISNQKERIKLGSFSTNLVKNPDESQEDFVRRIWNETALQKNGGVLKYSKIMSPNPSKTEILEILEKLRFIVLCLTGQEKPENFGWDGKSLRTEINFNSTRIDSMDIPSLSRELEEIIKSVCPGIEIL